MIDVKYLLDLSDRHASAIMDTGYKVNDHTVSCRGVLGKIGRKLANVKEERLVVVSADISRRVRCPVAGDTVDLGLGYGCSDLWFLCGSEVVPAYALVGKCGRMIMAFRTPTALSQVYYQISKNSRKSWRKK